MREDLRLGEKENQIQQNIVSTMWFCSVRLLGAVGLSASEVNGVCVCVVVTHKRDEEWLYEHYLLHF